MTKRKIKLYADVVLLVGYVVVNIPQSTGVPVHEWASLVFVVPLVVHILMDWSWVVGVTRRIFGRLPGRVRFNHALDLLIFVMMTVAMMSGLVISEAALPALGIAPARDPFWSIVHDVTANLTILLIGIHLAMHWPWIRNALAKAREPARAKRGAPGAIMRAIRTHALPTGIVLATATAVGLAASLLDTTAWAEGIRQGAPPPDASDGPGSGVARLFLPTVKVMVIMGIGGLFTGAGLWLAGRLRALRSDDSNDSNSTTNT